MEVDLAACVLRVVVGVTFTAQGFRKVFGDREAPFGREALIRLISSKGLPSPELLAALTSLTELTGGLLVLLGLFTRLALIPLMLILLVAILRFKLEVGYFGGWDWPFSVLSSSVALFLIGPGEYSLDAVLGWSQLLTMVEVHAWV
jgi:uncharacterized membrane protein YphA (DoxX/SURF4 family)